MERLRGAARFKNIPPFRSRKYVYGNQLLLPSVAIDLKVNGWNAQGEPWKFAVIALPLVSSPVTLAHKTVSFFFLLFYFPAVPDFGKIARDARYLSALTFQNIVIQT